MCRRDVPRRPLFRSPLLAHLSGVIGLVLAGLGGLPRVHAAPLVPPMRDPGAAVPTIALPGDTLVFALRTHNPDTTDCMMTGYLTGSRPWLECVAGDDPSRVFPHDSVGVAFWIAVPDTVAPGSCRARALLDCARRDSAEWSFEVARITRRVTLTREGSRALLAWDLTAERPWRLRVQRSTARSGPWQELGLATGAGPRAEFADDPGDRDEPVFYRLWVDRGATAFAEGVVQVDPLPSSVPAGSISPNPLRVGQGRSLRLGVGRQQPASVVVRIHDLSGRRVYEGTPARTGGIATLDASVTRALRPGVYLLTHPVPGGTHTSRLVVLP